MLGSALLKGMSVTAKNLVGSYFDKDRLTTIEYPEERKEPEQNYRNFPFLVYDDDKDPDHLRCVACKICETECPPQCIYIEVMRDENGKIVKQPGVFDIDYSVCMGCQICVEACPFDAIKMDHEYELATENRFGGLLIDKKHLARPNTYYHSIKPDEATEVDARLSAGAAKKKPAPVPGKPGPAATPQPSTSAPKAMSKTSNIPVPTDAPFSTEQREWLQRFFSQLSLDAPIGSISSATPLKASAETGAGAAVEEAPAEAVNPDLTNDAPWHDPDKDIGSRLKMADGKPLPVRLYAAMGQTDCTACGYDCKGYAQALAAGTEKDPGLCVPGADETAVKVKELLDEAGIKV